MSSQNIRRMVTTAILVALTIVFQLMRPVLGGNNIISTYIIGSLVNLALIVAACAVGLWSGVVVAVITPIIALMQGHATLVTMPGIILGNIVLVVIYALWAQKDKTSLKVSWVRWTIVGVIAALVKYAAILLGIAAVMAPVNHKAFFAVVSTLSVPQHVQIVTAIVALVLGGIIVPMLPAPVVGKTAVKGKAV
jgi:hypothetical protein